MPENFPRPLRRDLVSPILVVLVLVVITLWPGDVSWLTDEPRLIAAAWHANHDGQIAVGGLYGNFGIRYGPLPTQIYQLLLLITHDPITLVVLRSLLCAGACGAGLLWLARSLNLPGWFAAGVLISPHVVAYQRVLWDASFAMPVSVLALATFADFLRTDRAWSLRLCVTASVLAPSIHPQALPLAVPILGWLAWQQRAALWKDRCALGVIAIVLLILNGFYLAQFIGQVWARLTGSVQKGYPGGGSHVISALAPFFGGKLLCGADYLETLAQPEIPAWLHSVAAAGAYLFYPLAWLGILIGGWNTWRIVQRWRSTRPTTFAISPRETVTFVVFTGLVFQALLFGAMRIPAAPQYFFGTFALHAMIAWLAVDALCRWSTGAMPGLLYVLGGAALTIEAAASIHVHGFEYPRWPTLASSVGVTRELNRFADSTALTNVAVYRKAPQILRTLRLLLPPKSEELPSAGNSLLITSTKPEKPGETEVVRLAPSDFTTSPDLGRIETTPLPKDWVPDPGTW